MVGIKKKLDRREAVRERKALSAAHLERSIEKELIERLTSKAYGDAPLNVNENVWQAILDREKRAAAGLNETELDMEDDETDEELENEEEGEFEDEREFVSDLSGDEDDGLSDLEDVAVSQFSFLTTISYHTCRTKMIQTTSRRHLANGKLLHRTQIQEVKNGAGPGSRWNTKMLSLCHSRAKHSVSGNLECYIKVVMCITGSTRTNPERTNNYWSFLEATCFCLLASMSFRVILVPSKTSQ